MTPSGIEPATFRFVAQYLNHCATISGPPLHTVAMVMILPHLRRQAFQLFLKRENKFGYPFAPPEHPFAA
jgi:hypothetical protein